MKKLIAITLLSLSTAALAYGILKGESEDGLNKICYYDTPRGTAAITIPGHKMCPATID